LILVSFHLSAQTCTVNAIQFKPSIKFFSTQAYTVSFPVITTRDKKIGDKINETIQRELIDAEFMDLPFREAMKATLENGLISMSYSVTFNRDGICSITIAAEGCGAYCSAWYRYLNFDLNSGEIVSIDDMIKKVALNSLKDRVFKDKIVALNKYKEEMQEALVRQEVDSSTYHWALTEVDGYCINTINMDAISLTDSGIEIKDRCEFPHAIQSQAPSYDLVYDYKLLEGYLEERYLRIFLIK